MSNMEMKWTKGNLPENGVVIALSECYGELEVQLSRPDDCADCLYWMPIPAKDGPWQTDGVPSRWSILKLTAGNGRISYTVYDAETPDEWEKTTYGYEAFDGKKVAYIELPPLPDELEEYEFYNSFS